MIGVRENKNDENESKYVIVSNDTGYDNVIAFWKSKKIDVSRKQTANKKKSNTKNTPSEKTILNNRISQLLSKHKLDGETINKIASFVVKKSDEKNKKKIIRDWLIKTYDQETGEKYYDIIKDEL